MSTNNGEQKVKVKRIVISVSQKETIIELISENQRKSNWTEFKQYIEQCQDNRRVFVNEFEAAKKLVTQVENSLIQIQKNIRNKIQQEVELLESKILEGDLSIANLQDRLQKKQHGTFAKFLVRVETIENIKLEIEKQSAELIQLKSERERSKADMNLSSLCFEDCKTDIFYCRFLHLKTEMDRIILQLKEARIQFNIAESKYNDASAHIDIRLDQDIEAQYELLAKSFHKLTMAAKIWDITSESDNFEVKSSAKNIVSRQEVRFGIADIDIVKTNDPPFYMQNANGDDIYIYAPFVILMSKDNSFNIIDIRTLSNEFRKQRFLEEKKTIPADAPIIDTTWAKINKDGTPDMRFAGNYQIPVVHYGVITLSADKLFTETYHISNQATTQAFSEELQSYLALLRGKGAIQGHTITRHYFGIVQEFGDKYAEFFSGLINNRRLAHQIAQSGILEKLEMQEPNELIELYQVRDLIKCFGMTASIEDIFSNEGFALLFVISRRHNLVVESYSELDRLFSPAYLTAYTKLIKTIQTGLESSPSERLELMSVLAQMDDDIAKEYLAHLYRFASIVVKADGKVTAEEEAGLKKIMNMSSLQQPNIVSSDEHTTSHIKITHSASGKNLQSAIDELHSLTGLEDVKQEVDSLINFIKIQKAREASGLKSSSVSYHIVFTGNPGTGKTTVARIIADIYKHIGVLAKGHLVEIDRSGLVAEYLGQTAVKVNKAVDSALDGVLFIDEAYSLVGENKDDFGKEAVATLIKRMEDNRDRLVIILAGYSKEMRNFIEVNPGFKSRFNRYIEFKDYTIDELIIIYMSSCKKLEYTLTPEAESVLAEIVTRYFNSRDVSFGNGRFIRNLFEKTLEKQSNRIASIANLTREILTTITSEDIPA